MNLRIRALVLGLLLTGCAPLVGGWAGGTTAALATRYQKTETVAVGVGIGVILGWTIHHLLLRKEDKMPRHTPDEVEKASQAGQPGVNDVPVMPITKEKAVPAVGPNPAPSN